MEIQPQSLPETLPLTSPLKVRKAPASRSPKAKTVNALADILDIVVNLDDPNVAKRVPANEVLAAINKQQAHSAPVSDFLDPDDRFTYVTSHNLRRSNLTGSVKHAKIVLSQDDFRHIIAFGLQHGITWDEVIRGIIAEQRTSYTPFVNVPKFIPQP